MPSDVDIQEVNWDRLVWTTDQGSVLGQGSFGVVYLGALDGSPVAIKVVKPSVRTGSLSDETNAEAEASAMKQHRREIHRLAAMRNPYVIQYLGVFRNPQSRALYIVTEYLEGRSLHESMCRMRARNAVLDERSFLAIAGQMVYGLNHVHMQLYTHGDIKPQNILLSAPLTMTKDKSGAFTASFPQSAKVKIADFGLSKRLKGAKNVFLNDMTVATSEFGEGPCGTYLYMAPEVFGGVAQLSDADAKAADIYAYGLILFELLSGVQSWSLEGVRNIMQLSWCVHEGKRPSWGERRSQINPKYIDLVERCWRHEPSKRPNAGDVVVEIKALSSSFEDQSVEVVAQPTLTAEATLSPSPNATPSSPRDERVNVKPKASSSRLGNDSGRATPSLPPEIHGGDFPNRHGEGAFAASTELKAGDSQPSRRRHGKCAQDELPQPVSRDPIAVQDKIPSNPVTIPKIRRLHIVGTESQKLEAPSKPTGSCASFHDDGVRGEPSEPTNDTYASTGVHVPPKNNSATSAAPLQIGASDNLCPARLDTLNDVRMPQKENRHPSNAVENLRNDQAQPIDVLEAGHDSHGIDDSFLGGVQVMRVQTFCLPTPSPLQVPQDPEGRATMGTGSIEPNARPPSSQERRSGDDILNSFIQCGNSEVHVDEDNEMPKCDVSDIGGDYSLNEESKKRTLPKVQGSSTVERNSAKDYRNSSIGPIASDGGAVRGLPVVAELPLPLLQLEIKEQSQWPMERIQLKPKSRETPSSETHNVRVDEERRFSSNVARPQHQVVQSHLPRSPSEGFSISPTGMGNVVLSPPPDPNLNTHVESIRFEDATIRAQKERPLTTLTSYQPYGTMTGQGATAPLLSETGYGATGSTMLQTPTMSKIPTRLPGRPEHSTPGCHNFENLMTKQCRLLVPHSDMEEVCHALRTPDAVKQLGVLWNQGCTQAVAGALAQAHDLKGGDFLSLTCDFLGPHSSGKHDPFVDMGLCTAIGNISRNASDSIKPQLVLQALRVTVSTMFAYRTTFAKNELASVELYTSCNFALCNLLKVNNSIEDVKLRSDLAKWILYVISWKISDNGSARGAQADTLCYEATCAARNFMWRNEANAQAFTEETGVRDAQLIESLIASMKQFDWKGNGPLSEACLSAVAVAITIPQHRKEFMNLQGIALVLGALHGRLDEVKKAKVGLSMITALIVWSGNRMEERDILEDVCVKDQVCVRLLKLLEVMQNPWRPNQTKLEALSIGYGTLLRCMELGEQLHEKNLYETAVQMTSLTVKKLCTSSENGSGVLRARNDLCVQVCDVLQLLAREPRARLLLQQETSVYLKQLMGDRGHDEAVIGCMRTTLNILEKSQ
ncbi:Serine/threonine protein kinase [Chondrus crispus]|uniref:Serine/threonine protein kinase n=1 Tax=Chondrus crispus TaxID=2769 RepID=R7Q6T7_CHOCR|nr:Serine/threonine protein kinase [Chondrus crispus]CDF33185.1 Serine/threonine protein kinase [Chondrus crispus]|eukprot:XP_005712988.1 Serine/threonine protein kinase [Chondrus crispus]